MHWILDFDDTLVLGPNTWAFEEVLPELIRHHNLPYDKALFDEVMLKAQKQANEDVNEEELLNHVFETLNWPAELQAELMNRVFNGYQPCVFEDTLRFLDFMQEQGHRLYIISNNNHASSLTEALGIEDYFDAIVTPKQSGARAKPQRDMWDELQSTYQLDGDIYMVGDDPWSDGTFSQHAEIPCWIIDRLARYTSLHDLLPFCWARTFDEIINRLKNGDSGL
jgi:HAD superfamily hydrolase (TIGR01549 family)